MRLSEWTAAAPAMEAVSPRVLGVIEPVLRTLGADPDPACWVAWGEEPATRWLVMVPTVAGLAVVHVRVNVPQEGPRANGKLVRWPRVQVGEFTVEAQLGHRIVSTSVEGAVLRATDAAADEIGAFLQVLFAGMDGRPLALVPSGAGDAGGSAR